MNSVANHDRTSADHQAQVDDLSCVDFRMISLSVYGNRSGRACFMHLCAT